MSLPHRTSLLLVTLALILSGCSELLVNESETDQNIQDFESAWKTANTVYPFFEFKAIDWDSIHTIYKPQALSAEGDEIYFVLYDMFSELKDGHVEIHTEGGFPVVTYLWPRQDDRKGFSPTVIRKYFNKPLRLAGDNRIDYEFINSTTGYVHFPSFTKGDWIQDFDEILDYFKNTKGLIIDVRNNSGGSNSTYNHVISRFISEPMEEAYFLQNGQKQSWTIQPRGPFRYKENVVILINGASFSAAEIFPELMRQLPNVTLVGDTTGGGGASVDVFPLPSGKRLKMPRMYFVRLDGELVEWNGVLPDILVEQTETDVKQGRDKQLEYAIQLLKN